MFDFFCSEDSQITQGLLTVEDLDHNEKYTVDLQGETIEAEAINLLDQLESFNLYHHGEMIATTEI